MARRAGGWALALGFSTGLAAAAGKGETPIRWQEWSDAAFDRARKEDRLVLLDLEAVWCHWCHVMDATTYQDPEVVGLIGARFVPVRVDQDARPDLANRYEDYGWPATVVFDGSGRELLKFQGYIAPARMRSLLRALIADPTPGPSVGRPAETPPSESAALSEELRRGLARLFVERYDSQHRGWGFTHKFLDWDSVEWALARARAGDAQAERMARETLATQRAHLIDPIWGGVYHYSDGGVWTNPHFEKIMVVQAENLRIYAQAYSQWRDPADLKAALDIHRYLQGFLRSPAGAFYASQDADVVRGKHSAGYFALADAKRRALGTPRIDTHLYTRENAWAVNALVALYGATGKVEHLTEALRAAEWIVAQRSLEGGGFRHDARDAAGPYLGDTLAAGRAFLALYAATAERGWLARAEAAAGFITARFRQPGASGLATAVPRNAVDRPAPQREENVQAARFANLLFHYTGQARHRDLASHAMRYLATPAVARRFNSGGVLLADAELGSDPLHVTVVGRRDAAAAQELLRSALALPGAYARVELWDRRAGPLPRGDVTYPQLPRAAAFLCTQGRCSAPVYTAAELRRRVQQLERPGQRAGVR